jgi:hypothetical protein
VVRSSLKYNVEGFDPIDRFIRSVVKFPHSATISADGIDNVKKYGKKQKMLAVVLRDARSYAMKKKRKKKTNTFSRVT